MYAMIYIDRIKKISLRWLDETPSNNPLLLILQPAPPLLSITLLQSFSLQKN